MEDGNLSAGELLQIVCRPPPESRTYGARLTVVPPKTEYSLTELGRTLVPLIKDICDWGDAYFELADVPTPCEGINPYA